MNFPIRKIKVRIKDSETYLHMEFSKKNLMAHCIVKKMLLFLRHELFCLYTILCLKESGDFHLGCKRLCNYSGYLCSFTFRKFSWDFCYLATFPYNTQSFLKILLEVWRNCFWIIRGGEKNPGNKKKWKNLLRFWRDFNWNVGLFEYFRRFL